MITQSQTAKPVRMAAVAVIAGVIAGVAACSSGSGASNAAGTPSRTSSAPHTGSPTANASTCKHVDSARTSLQNLTHLKLSASAATKIRTDLTNIQAQLAVLKSEGVSPPLSTSLNQLSASLKQVEEAAKGLSANATKSEITAVVTALSALKTQSASTISAMKAACPG